MRCHPCGLALALVVAVVATLSHAVGCDSDDTTGPGTGAGAPGGGGGATGGAGGGTAGTGGGTACEPNETELCDCDEGIGSRRCAANGSGWSACECVTYGAEIAVSPDGDDGGQGTLDDPFQTLGRARQAVAEAVTAGLPDGGLVVWLREGRYPLTDTLTLGTEHSGSADRPVVWRGYPGEWARVMGGVELAPSAFAPIAQSSPIYDRLDPTAQAQVVAIELGSHGITDVGALVRRGFCGQASEGPLELYVDGQPMTLARWPDATENDVPANLETADGLDLYGSPQPDVTGHYTKSGESDGVSAFMRDGLVGGLQYYLYRRTWDYDNATHTAWFLTTQDSGYPGNGDPWWYLYDHDLGPMQASNGGAGLVTPYDPAAINHGFAAIAEALSDTQWRYSGDRPSRWTAATEVWFHGFWRHAWADCHVAAATIDVNTQTVTMADDVGYGIAEGQPYYAYDLPEEITTAGEYWIDRSSATLYLWPPAGFSSAEIVAATVAAPLIRVNDGSHVELRDFVLEASRAELVRVDGGDHVELVGLTLRNTGTNGAVLSGTDHAVRACHLHDTGNGGLRLSGGDRPSLTPANHVVEQSHFHHLSRWEWVYRPAINLSGVGATARHNEMHHAPHSAILYGGNDHLIELNEIYEVCLFSSDAGAIYAGRDWGARGNVVRHNFLHHIDTHFQGYGVHGVYMDDCLSGILVEGNVFYDISGHAIQHGGGRDDIMVNNVIAQCGSGVSADSRGYEWQPNGGPNNTPGDSWNLLEKLQNVGYQDEPWASRWPECAAIPNDWNAIIDPNASWLYPEGSVFARNIGFANDAFVRANQATRDAYASIADNLEDTDPGFVDEANLDLSLQPDSAAYDIPGFQEIPFGTIGIQP